MRLRFFQQHPELPQGFSASVVVRFWDKVNKTGPIPEHVPALGHCWQWLGRPDFYGYGWIARGSHNGGNVKAHRFSWLLHTGHLPTKHVLHKCDNSMCVNPAHLFEGTDADNIRDMIRKGRDNFSYGGKAPKGETHHLAKLTSAMVKEIRATFTAQHGLEEFGRKYGVRGITIYRVINRFTWKDE